MEELKLSLKMEPFKIKATEPITFQTKQQRKEILKKAHLNLFLVSSKNIIIDLLTDSGTGAMSTNQYSTLLSGDESYAGSESFDRFQKTIQSITKMPLVLPTHQGRAAERLLLETLRGKGEFVISNMFFDTTRANAIDLGFKALDLPCDESRNTSKSFSFKGNIHTEKLERALKEKCTAGVFLTITNNSIGGQPVSLSNIKHTSQICKKYHVPLILDACRFAENSWFIREREEPYHNHSPLDIAQQCFNLSDMAFVSTKKDGLSHVGGFIVVREKPLFEKLVQSLLLKEGFPTYGGLAGRDLEAISVGLKEALDPHYLNYRISSVKYLHDKLHHSGIPLVHPCGGHAVYIDAGKLLAHIPQSAYPGQAFVSGLYEESGIRSCEIGSIMLGGVDSNGKQTYHKQELVRLAIPRRVYTQSHLDYVAQSIIRFSQERGKSIKGVRFTYEPKRLRHFRAHFDWL